MNIFVGNLNAMTTTSHLISLFLPFGIVRSVKIIHDSPNGRSLAIGYIQMNDRCAKMAIYELNNMKFMNYFLEVTEADV